MTKFTNVVEVFSGIQGEGPIVGYRQIFIRFTGCQLNCQYCDTNFAIQEQALIEESPGRRNFLKVSNPLSDFDLYTFVKVLNEQLEHHSISLTGGEPLLHADFLQSFLPMVQPIGVQVYLETNGLLTEELQKVLPWIDVIGMDIKLESATQEVTQWEVHKEFLELAKDKNVFVKVVCSEKSTKDEIQRVARLVQAVGVDIPLILQPVTAFQSCHSPTPQQVIDFMDTALLTHKLVRVIPQTHVMLQQL
ncbi:hypothetical protein BHU72_02850 [Desulfuribacillus stibiiarsenatis]|uniref:7-carboxy-7-deazaguanine synthase n=1 Tax=Desulfuribacillus stibiiarsenatis TaxID=1390249 RepID=A0A1E5L6I9_9FIRM|nr:7-carboxy-7-deazaguanine synthase QueE [Desulfuribacillus stibiiarsenatis]OEH85736.1 hypothetical protein BHU72_02850 [Desulfuribacillus stibiiarsenatis]